MTLADISASSVLQAIAEFDRLGRDAFLSHYRFGRARRYWLVHEGRRYDSKAIVGAAHGFLPGEEPLPASAFSGGDGHAVGILRRLGFEVVDEDQVVSAIRKLRPALVAGKPMLKQAVVLLWAIGRATRDEERLLPWEDTLAALTPLLETHQRPGERAQGRPDYPIAALHRAGLWDLPNVSETVPPAHGDSALRAWFDRQRPDGGLPLDVHTRLQSSGQARIMAIDAIIDRFFEDLDYSTLLMAVGLYDDEVASDAAFNPEVSYQQWCSLVVEREAHTYGQRRPVTRNDPIRLAPARRAVLLRSEGRCENPDCRRPAPDITDRGEPVLEVDHIAQITDGGRDHPVQMIALCPNCHAVKTRGRSRTKLTATLRAAAQTAHEAWS